MIHIKVQQTIELISLIQIIQVTKGQKRNNTKWQLCCPKIKGVSMIQKEKYQSMLKDLEYVCRISPISGLITSRALLESMVNDILHENKLMIESEIGEELLGRKIEILDKNKFLKTRELTLIRNILFKGNDAAHKLKGEESTALSAFDDLMSFYSYITNMREKKLIVQEITEIPNKELKEKRKTRGIIEKYDGEKIGFVKDIENKELYIFSVSSLEKVDSNQIQIGDYIQFDLVENNNKKKAKYKAINIEHVAKVNMIGYNTKNERYAFLQCGNRVEDIYLNIYSIKEPICKIKKGQELIVSIKSGANKNEAYDVRMA